jgi:S1/P1 Nuclease
MHVTTGYYDTTLEGFSTRPVRIDAPAAASAGGVLGDRGGNGLLFSTSEANNVHALWDKCLVGLVAGSNCSNPASEYTPLARQLAAAMTTNGTASTPGDYHDWPGRWATDSIQQAVASAAYGFKLRDGVVHVSHTGEQSTQAVITSPGKTKYAADHVGAAQGQLIKAARRLAELLNAIDWK